MPLDILPNPNSTRTESIAEQPASQLLAQVVFIRRPALPSVSIIKAKLFLGFFPGNSEFAAAVRDHLPELRVIDVGTVFFVVVLVNRAQPSDRLPVANQENIIGIGNAQILIDVRLKLFNADGLHSTWSVVE